MVSGVSWSAPRLLKLPNQYDAIFQAYRKRVCALCSEAPLSPSVCLICGAFICFKEVCCQPQSGVSVSWCFFLLCMTRFTFYRTIDIYNF